MVKVPATFWNLLKKLGRKPEGMMWSRYGDRFAATDLSRQEMSVMKETAEWCREQRMAPICGYISEQPKGTYFVPVDVCLPIMKIACPPLKRRKVKGSPYSLHPAWMDSPKVEKSE